MERRRWSLGFFCVWLMACAIAEEGDAEPPAADTPPDAGRAPASAPDARDAASRPTGATGGEAAASGETMREVMVEGVRRSYLLHVPASAADAMKTGRVPLIVLLHGAGDDARHFLDVTQLRPLAAKRAFVVAVPNVPEGFAGTGQPSSVDRDAKLVLAVVRDGEGACALDPKRLYLTGFSRGAGFVGLFATASSNPDPTARTLGVPQFRSVFAAYAVSAGYDMFRGKVDLAKADPKRPFWLLHARGDDTVPFREGESFAAALRAGGWPSVTLTAVEHTPSQRGHNWLWQAVYGHPVEELWEWLSANALP